ncbi:MAG: hypothetical protein LBI87_15515 [Candidatus Accumulibacter sp.]|jgi:hypothetical protein|nr:hypothetical protein [Accumulibacter sp.]
MANATENKDVDRPNGIRHRETIGNAAPERGRPARKKSERGGGTPVLKSLSLLGFCAN